MSKYASCVIDPQGFPAWEAQDQSRCVSPLITDESCDSKQLLTGLWRLYPGHESDSDIHPDADEIYYVVSGAGKLLLGDEEYVVRAGMTIFIPAGVRHQSFNTGDENLVYYFIFAPPPGGPPKQQEQAWVKIQ
ncbi:MAG: cupin domain-containing protein [Lentisphaeria bacterium]|jgi:mannose-6-phosphate isomerase-like protein (cupin superfamily)|nr:cupin domain-containing protein [Lentisphaeria bacterium]